METRENFEQWFSSENKKMRLCALRYQWIKVLKNQDLYMPHQILICDP